MHVLRTAAAVTIALCLSAAPAQGHAALRDSDPANGASLAQAPAAITLVFTEEPEPGLSQIRVLDAQGRQVQRGAAQAVPGNPFALRQPLERIGRGAYTVSWRTVSRVDGHLTSGTTVFGVGIVPSSMPESGPQQPAQNPITAAGRWCLYVGLVLLLGAAWVWALALPRHIPPPPWVYAASALALIGITGIAAGQRDAAGVSWGQFFATFLGYASVYRAFPVAAATAAFVLVKRGGRHRQAALAAAAVLIGVAMLVHVYAGHAGAGGGMARWIRVMLQWIHLAGVGIWLGGLAALLLGLPHAMDAEKAAAARRYSNGAAVGLAAVVFTGVLRAVDAVGGWASLWSMLYGRLVLAKVVLLLILAGLGAVNRYRNVPAVLARLRALRTIGAAEIALAIVVLAITGVLTGLAPPRTLRDVPPSTSLAATGMDFASTIRVRLEVTPGRPGLNRFMLRVVDYDTGRPSPADEVQLRLSPGDRPEIAASSMPLTKTNEGTYRGQGAGLSLAGPWDVVASVRRGVDVLRVPLRITVRDPQTVRTVTAPGQPTLYTIELLNGTQLQLYLLPAGPGPATVHMTFFDAGGNELSIPDSPTVTVIAEGSEPVAFTVRRLSPGHFLADGRLRRDRPVELQILAVNAGGEFIRASLTVRPP